MKKYLLCLFLCAAFVLSIAGSFAHPLPLCVQEFYFKFYKDKTDIIFKLHLDPLVVDQVYYLIDTDKSNEISEQEMNTWASESIQKKIAGSLNSRDLKLIKTGQKVIPKAKFESLDDFIEIDYTVENPKILETNSFVFKYNQKFLNTDPYSDLTVYEDNTASDPNIERINSSENTTYQQEEYDIDFKFKNFAPAAQTTGTSQPVKEGDANQPVNPLKPETSSKNGIQKAFDSIAAYSRKLTGTIFNNGNGPLFIILGLLISFIAGALHSITPGHGKSLMAAFLVGKKGSKIGDVLVLGGAITFSHTIVIFVLGFILLALNKKFSVNSVLPYFEKFSAVLLFFLGYSLLKNGLRAYKYRGIPGYDPSHSHSHDELEDDDEHQDDHHDHHHSHDEHDHDHSHHNHKHDHNHDGHAHDHHTYDHDGHSHSHGAHDAHDHSDLTHSHGLFKHTHFKGDPEKVQGKWSLFLAGISGGIVPCVDALSLLVLAAGLGKVGYGLVLIFFFSLGLAASIISIGLLLIYGKNKLNVEERFGNLATIYAPMFSGAVILSLAIWYILK